MLVAAAVCPHSPALLPAVSQRGFAVLADVRAACVQTLRALAAVDADLRLAVGVGPETARFDAASGGSLGRFGTAVRRGGAAAVLPEALTIAVDLAEEAGLRLDGFQAIARGTAPEPCAAVGAALGVEAARVALLVMGDGSAKRSKTAPGYLDGRAESFDRAADSALATGDWRGLLAIEPAFADELWVAGREAWQVLAGALQDATPTFAGEPAYVGAPLGVGYAVLLLRPGVSAS